MGQYSRKRTKRVKTKKQEVEIFQTRHAFGQDEGSHYAAMLNGNMNGRSPPQLPNIFLYLDKMHCRIGPVVGSSSEFNRERFLRGCFPQNSDNGKRRRQTTKRMQSKLHRQEEKPFPAAKQAKTQLFCGMAGAGKFWVSARWDGLGNFWFGGVLAAPQAL